MHADAIGEEVLCLRVAEQMLREVCGLYHLELYKVRGSLMTAYLVQGRLLFSLIIVSLRVTSGDYQSALELCRHIVGFLSTILVVPYHPLLGLQLFTLGSHTQSATCSFTLGDILQMVGDEQSAASAYEHAKEVCGLYLNHT